MRGFAAQKWPTVHAHLQRSVTLSVSHTSSGVSSFALIQWSTIWRQGQRQLWQTHRLGSLLDLFPPVEWSGKEKKKRHGHMISKTMRNSGEMGRDGENFGISKRSPLPLLYYSSPPPPICIMKEINFVNHLTPSSWWLTNKQREKIEREIRGSSHSRRRCSC